jgi:hypothetical protein
MYIALFLFVCFGAKIIEDFIWTTKSVDIFLMRVKNNSGGGVAGEYCKRV